MASKELMGWDPDNKRWIKNAYLPGNRRKMLAISPRQLVKLYPDLTTTQTKDGTRVAANAWWEAQEKKLASDPLCDAIDRSIEQGRIKQRKIDAAIAVLERQGVQVSKELKSEIFLRATEIEPGEVVSNANRSLIDAYLKTQRAKVNTGSMSTDRYEASRNHVEAFAKWIGTTENESILSIDPTKWQEFYDWLGDQIAKHRKWRAGGKTGKRDGFSPAYARDIFNSTRLFVEWLGEIGQMAVPSNIRSKKMVFRVPKKKIETFSLEEVRTLIAGCTVEIGERTKLYLLLMLNCGMYQSDVSDLVWSEFDAKLGTITRKRSKTDDYENCPEVTWYLWPETLRLLKKYANNDKTILNQKKSADTGTNCISLLVTAKGGPLVAKTLQDEKGKKSDNIKSAYVRLANRLKVPTKPLMLIRKTSSTMLGDHKDYKFYAQYFLAQAPETTADGHYVRPSETEFKAACEWLWKQYAFDKPKAK